MKTEQNVNEPLPASGLFCLGRLVRFIRSIGSAVAASLRWAKLIGYVTLVAAAVCAMNAGILKKGLLSLLKTYRTKIVSRLIVWQSVLLRVNKRSRIWLYKLVAACLYVPVSILCQLALDLASIGADLLHFALRVQDQALGVNQAAKEFAHGRLRLRIGREITNALGHANRLLRGTESSRNGGGKSGDVNHGGVGVGQNDEMMSRPQKPKP